MGKKPIVGGVVRSAFFIFVAILASVLFTAKLEAFSLLGPYADWMDVTNGFRQPGDVGGPMDITEGYRWNVPVVTYGFDRSFIDYFGSNGVAAVEAAIAVLNGLPPCFRISAYKFAEYFAKAQLRSTSPKSLRPKIRDVVHSA